MYLTSEIKGDNNKFLNISTNQVIGYSYKELFNYFIYSNNNIFVGFILPSPIDETEKGMGRIKSLTSIFVH